MEGHLVMSGKERRRKVEFEGVGEGRLTIKEAAAKLRMSYRQCRRSYKRFREEGDAGLVHRRRGQRSNRAKPEAFKREALERCRERYEGFGPVLSREKLAEEGYLIGTETLRVWLLEEGLWQARRKRALGTGSSVNAKSILANWCRWMVATMSGLGRGSRKAV